jgi:hypothetical protein
VRVFVARPRPRALHVLLGFFATNFLLIAHRRRDAA